MAVLFLHFRHFLWLPPAVVLLAAEGKIGVSFFFTLSGFILYFTYHRHFAGRLEASALARFFQARVARVYPLHVLTLVAITPLVMDQLRYPAIAIQRYGPDVMQPLQVIASWVTNLLLVDIYVPLVGGSIFTFSALWNTPSWSIATEAAFYVSFPFFAAWVLHRFESPRALLGLMAGLYAVELSALYGASWLVNQVGSIQDKAGITFYLTYHLPMFRAWEFFIGMACGKLFLLMRDRIPNSSTVAALRSVAIMAVLGAILALMLLPSWAPLTALPPEWRSAVQQGRWYAFYTPLFAGLIFLMASGRHFLSRPLEWRPLVILGEASYALYMLHWLPLTVLSQWQIQGTPAPHGAVWLVLGGLIALSVVVFYGFEGPVRKLLRPRDAAVTVPAPAPGAFRRAGSS